MIFKNKTKDFFKKTKVNLYLPVILSKNKILKNNLKLKDLIIKLKPINYKRLKTF
jgi:hypothetical protein